MIDGVPFLMTQKQFLMTHDEDMAWGPNLSMIDLNWLPGVAVGIVVGALGFWRKTGISEAQLKAELDNLRQEFNLTRENDRAADGRFHDELSGLQDELREAVTEFRTASMNIAKLSASQEVINTVTSKALEGILQKQEGQAHAITEANATMRLLSELLKRIERNERERTE